MVKIIVIKHRCRYHAPTELERVILELESCDDYVDELQILVKNKEWGNSELWITSLGYPIIKKIRGKKV